MILKYPRIAEILGNEKCSCRERRMEDWRMVFPRKSLEQKSSLHRSMPLRTETTLKIQIFMLIYLSGYSAIFKIWIVLNSSGLRAQWVRVLAVWVWGPEFRPPAPLQGGLVLRACAPSTVASRDQRIPEACWLSAEHPGSGRDPAAREYPENDIAGHPVCTSDLRVGTWVCTPSHV